MTQTRTPISPLRHVVAGTVLLGATCFATSLGATADPGSGSHFSDLYEREGIRVEVDLKPFSDGGQLQEGTDASFQFRVTDTLTGQPMSGAYPAAWMDLRRIDKQSNGEEVTCQDKLKSFLSGSLMSQPELDLNVYYVLVMNQDASISVVDPLFGFGGSKLLDMVRLPSPAQDWVLSEDQRTLFVSMPEAGSVAVIRTADWRVLEKIALGAAPRRLALQGDGRYLWIGIDAIDDDDGEAIESGVAVLDVASRELVGRVATTRSPSTTTIATPSSPTSWKATSRSSISASEPSCATSPPVRARRRSTTPPPPMRSTSPIASPAR